MLPVALSLSVLLALMLWRLVFAALPRESLTRETAAARRRNNNLFNRFGGFALGSDSARYVDTFDRNERAKAYLYRIALLTGARQTDTNDGYILDVGTTRFYVRDGSVARRRDLSDPKCKYEKTCFYLQYNSVPKAEQIASALLQLRNNPELFVRWAEHSGAYKPDGQEFDG
jgi:hypothetical protein